MTHKTYSFDGHGINGRDEYRTRLATLTNEGRAENVGPLFAAAPEMRAALEASERNIVDLCQTVNILNKRLGGTPRKVRAEDYAEKARAALATAEGVGS